VNIAFVAGLLAFTQGLAWADPPGRVVRLGYATGQVSFLPAGATDWVQADINRPLWTGDQLWTGPDARAELQMGNAVLRLAPGTSVSVTAFDDKTEQLQITQGTARFSVRSMDGDDAIELDTPNLAFAIRQPGDYRVDVDASTTTVGVYRGEAEAFGTQNAYTISAGNRVRFSGTDLGDYQPVAAVGRADTFDTWVGERTSQYEQSASARYVAPDVIGYQDLDSHGSWQQVPTYGNVWVPTSVAPDWAPYRFGHWMWLDPWGWTWVDDAPWGFTPFHYGRWAFVDSRWCWVPGPRTVRAVYAPALVGFVGAPNLGVSVAVGVGAGVAWFPLGPGEVYRPAYGASRDYFTRVNVTNTVVNVTQVTNIYNNPARTDIRYANVERPNAVTAVPTQAFVEARPVQRAAVKVDTRALQNTPVLAAPARVAPERASIVGSGPPAQARPAPAVAERTVIAKRAPPPPPVSIEQRQEALKRDPGKPLDTAELQRLAPAQAKPNVRVAQPSVAPKPLPAVAAAAAEKGKAANEKESPPQAARVQNEPPKAEPPKAPQPELARPNAQQPPGREPPTAAEKQNQPPGPIARPETPGRPQTGTPPTQEAQPRSAPGAAPPSTAEAQRQTARARPEATPRPTPQEQRERGEPLKRPGPEAAPNQAQTPHPPQTATARPEAAPRPVPPGQREREPQQGPPEPAQAPRAQPQAQRPPETAQQAPRAQPQPQQRAPETAQQAPRAQQPQPQRPPETAQAPRQRPQQPPRETPEPPRQQAAATERPQQQREQAPQQRAPQPKGKGSEDKDKKDEGGK
jgi:hypothetical protein